MSDNKNEWSFITKYKWKQEGKSKTNLNIGNVNCQLPSDCPIRY